MGFWGKLGKIGLKVAPYAAMAIPGVGPLAAAGIQAGIGAAQSKAGGGSWKDALKSGGMAAATSYAGGKIPGLGEGLSPSKNFVKESVNSTHNKLFGGGIKGALGRFGKETAKNIGRDIMERGPGVIMDDPRQGGISGNQGRAVSGEPSRGGRLPEYGGRMRGIGPRPLMMRDQNFPNLAEALNAGRQQAMRDQPFRGGYETTSYGPTEEQRKQMGPEIKTRMPPIGPRRRVA